MDYDQFEKKMEIIAKKMDRISRLTSNMALAGSANSSNPAFVNLMQKQEKLIKITEEMIESVTHQQENNQ